jgi:DNA/RNA-binding domain of Phe-tRNA-synthetase-like protein
MALGRDVCDRLMAGVVCMTGIAVRQEPAVWDETGALAAELTARHAGRLPSEISQLKEARTLYKSFGMDPSRHRPSSEALLRRVLKGQGLYRLNNVVDCCNLASLRFLLPIGLYDLAKVEGDISIRVGRDAQEYSGIRKGPVHLTGRLGLFDERGPFGSPTSDSLRTSITDSTTDILAVLMATASYDPARMQEHLSDFGIMVMRHCGGHVAVQGVLGGCP